MDTTSNPKRKAATILSLGVLCASIFTAGIAGATEPAPSTSTSTTVASSLDNETSPIDPSLSEPEESGSHEDTFPDLEPTDEDIAEINAEISKLTDALTEAGIPFTLETDEFGLHYPEWDEADDDRAWKVFEDVFDDMFIDDTDWDDTDWDDTDWDDTDWDDTDWEPTAEELAEINAEIAKEIDALEAAGITVIMEADEFGISFPTWEDADHDAAMAVLEELYGSFDDFLDGPDFDDADWELTAEETAEINEMIEADITALTDAGIAFTLEDDGFGFQYPIWDSADEDAAWAALDALWESQFELLDGGPESK